MKILFLLCKNLIDTRNIHVNKYTAEIFFESSYSEALSFILLTIKLCFFKYLLSCKSFLMITIEHVGFSMLSVEL